MVGIVVIVADYLPVLNRARATLLQAGHRVLTTTHAPAGYPLVGLYLPDAVVVLSRLGAADAIDRALTSLEADETTHAIPVVLLELADEDADVGATHAVIRIGAFDQAQLLHEVDGAVQRRAGLQRSDDAAPPEVVVHPGLKPGA